jgi:hypothetical protein
MSQHNGDKARFARERKKKLRNRENIRKLKDAPAARAAPPKAK